MIRGRKKDDSTLSLRLPGEQLRALKIKANAEGMTVGELARLAFFTILHAKIEYQAPIVTVRKENHGKQ